MSRPRYDWQNFQVAFRFKSIIKLPDAPHFVRDNAKVVTRNRMRTAALDTGAEMNAGPKELNEGFIRSFGRCNRCPLAPDGSTPEAANSAIPASGKVFDQMVEGISNVAKSIKLGPGARSRELRWVR